MSQFKNGILIGLGLGVLFAPKQGKELRRLLAQTWQNIRKPALENTELKQGVRQKTEDRKQ